MAWMFIYQQRKHLHLVETKAKFGFLYNGYRNPQAYYWEIVIMYRKIFVIFIQVFLGQLGKIVQVISIYDPLTSILGTYYADILGNNNGSHGYETAI